MRCGAGEVQKSFLHVICVMYMVRMLSPAFLSGPGSQVFGAEFCRLRVCLCLTSGLWRARTLSRETRGAFAFSCIEWCACMCEGVSFSGWRFVPRPQGSSAYAYSK